MRKVLMSDGKKKVLEKKNKFLRWENKFCTFFCSILMNLTFITALAGGFKNLTQRLDFIKVVHFLNKWNKIWITFLWKKWVEQQKSSPHFILFDNSGIFHCN